MTFRHTIAHLRKSPLDAWYYIQGSLRLKAYKSKFFRKFLRSHIVEQFEWRRDVAANPCFRAGQCNCCECTTPDLFFADKECSTENPKYFYCHQNGEKKCYPAMMNREAWKKFHKQPTTNRYE